MPCPLRDAVVLSLSSSKIQEGKWVLENEESGRNDVLWSCSSIREAAEAGEKQDES